MFRDRLGEMSLRSPSEITTDLAYQRSKDHLIHFLNTQLETDKAWKFFWQSYSLPYNGFNYDQNSQEACIFYILFVLPKLHNCISFYFDQLKEQYPDLSCTLQIDHDKSCYLTSLQLMNNSHLLNEYLQEYKKSYVLFIRENLPHIISLLSSVADPALQQAFLTAAQVDDEALYASLAQLEKQYIDKLLASATEGTLSIPCKFTELGPCWTLSSAVGLSGATVVTSPLSLVPLPKESGPSSKFFIAEQAEGHYLAEAQTNHPATTAFLVPGLVYHLYPANCKGLAAFSKSASKKRPREDAIDSKQDRITYADIKESAKRSKKSIETKILDSLPMLTVDQLIMDNIQSLQRVENKIFKFMVNDKNQRTSRKKSQATGIKSLVSHYDPKKYSDNETDLKKILRYKIREKVSNFYKNSLAEVFHPDYEFVLGIKKIHGNDPHQLKALQDYLFGQLWPYVAKTVLSEKRNEISTPLPPVAATVAPSLTFELLEETRGQAFPQSPLFSGLDILDDTPTSTVETDRRMSSGLSLYGFFPKAHLEWNDSSLLDPKQSVTPTMRQKILIKKST